MAPEGGLGEGCVTVCVWGGGGGHLWRFGLTVTDLYSFVVYQLQSINVRPETVAY